MHRANLLAVALFLAACTTAQGPAAPVSEPRIVRASEAGNVDYADGVAHTLTPPGRTDYAQLRLVERAGYRTPLHKHPQTDETFLVLQGELTVFLDGQLHTLGPGDYAFVPRNTPHAQGNRTNGETIVVLTLTPGDFAAFFEARQEIVADTPPGHPQYGERMMALGQRFDIEVLGPSPF